MSHGTVTRSGTQNTLKPMGLSQATFRARLMAVLLLTVSVSGTLAVFCGVPTIAKVASVWQQVILERPNSLSR
jgi:hypothetical protein